MTPGTYVITYAVFTGPEPNTDANLKKTFSLSITLTDPCDAVTMVESADVADQHYTITDNSYQYQLMPLFSVTPDICPTAFVLDVEGALNGVLTFDEAT